MTARLKILQFFSGAMLLLAFCATLFVQTAEVRAALNLNQCIHMNQFYEPCSLKNNDGKGLCTDIGDGAPSNFCVTEPVAASLRCVVSGTLLTSQPTILDPGSNCMYYDSKSTTIKTDGFCFQDKSRIASPTKCVAPENWNNLGCGDGKKIGDACETDGKCVVPSRQSGEIKCYHGETPPPVITITPAERKCVLSIRSGTFVGTTGGGLYSSKQQLCIRADDFYAEMGWVQDQACIISQSNTQQLPIGAITIITLSDGGKWDATAKKCALPGVTPPVNINSDLNPKLGCVVGKKLNDICETDGKCVAASRNGDLKCYHGASTPPPEIIITPGETNPPRACAPLDYIFSPIGCRCVILNRAKGFWEVGAIKNQGGRQLCIVPSAPETKPIEGVGQECDSGRDEVGCRCETLTADLRPVLGQRAKDEKGDFYCKVADTTVANTSPADGPRLCTAEQVVKAITSQKYDEIYGCKCNPFPVPGFAGGTIVPGPNNFPICKSDSDGVDITKPRVCSISDIARNPGKVIGCACSTIRGSKKADGIVAFVENKLKCNAYSAQN